MNERANNRNQSKVNDPQSGYIVVLFAGCILFILATFGYVVNISLISSEKARLEKLARVVAERGGAFLPDPVLARDAAFQLFSVLKSDLMRAPSSTTNPDPDLDMKVYFTSYKADKSPYDGNTATWESSTTAFDSTVVALPIKSMTVKLRKKFKTSLFDVFGGGQPDTDIVVESTTQIVPTDVVMIVENSNSLISPLDSADGINESQTSGLPNAFKKAASNNINWDGETTLKDPTGSPYKYKYNKALRYTRQCFGQSAKNVKKAAVLLYDLLSSASTVRVAVIHPLTAGGEVAHVAVPLTANPVERIDPGASTGVVSQNYLSTDYGIIADPNSQYTTSAAWPPRLLLEEEYGLADHPSTRCGAITDKVPFRVPSHPLASSLDSSYVDSKLIYDFTSTSDTGVAGGYYAAQSISDNTVPHLRFRAGTPTTGGNGRYTPDPAVATPISLLPREVIWIKNSGYVYNHGVANPRYNYLNHYAAVERALDVLYNAPARKDGLPVRRRIVLDLTDGIDDVSPIYNRRFYMMNSPQITLSNGEGFALKDNPISNTFNFCSATAAASLSLDTNLYEISSVTDSSSLTSADEILRGFKLGVMLYGFSGDYYSTDGYQHTLDYHNFATAGECATIDSFRTNCTTDWSMRRGRFWAEASPCKTSNQLKIPQGYVYYLTPAVARSILQPEVVN